jgi:Transposase DDE domain
LRRVTFHDIENDRRFVFLTNNFTLPALTIAKLYKCRWQVELFFKWIKQNLHIKSFYGTSDNAVRIQVWIAISVYVLVAIIKKELRVERSLSEILQILSLTLFEKIDKAFRIATPMRKASWTKRFAAGWGSGGVRRAIVGAVSRADGAGPAV